MTESEVAKLVAVLIAAFPGTRAGDETSAVYEGMLLDLDATVANAAVAQLVATKPAFMPSIAEIRERCASLTTGEIRAGGEGWGSVQKAIKRAGRYRVPGQDFTFVDPVVAEAVDAMGWVELCDSENATADRARFIELYDHLATRARRALLSECLPAMRHLRALQAANAPQLSERTRDTRTLKQLLEQNTVDNTQPKATT